MERYNGKQKGPSAGCPEHIYAKPSTSKNNLSPGRLIHLGRNYDFGKDTGEGHASSTHIGSNESIAISAVVYLFQPSRKTDDLAHKILNVMRKKMPVEIEGFVLMSTERCLYCNPTIKKLDGDTMLNNCLCIPRNDWHDNTFISIGVYFYSRSPYADTALLVEEKHKMHDKICLDKQHNFRITKLSEFANTFDMEVTDDIICFHTETGDSNMYAIKKGRLAPWRMRELVLRNNLMSPNSIWIMAPFRPKCEEFTQAILRNPNRHIHSYDACVERLDRRITMNNTWSLHNSMHNTYMVLDGLLYRAIVHELMSFEMVEHMFQSLAKQGILSLPPHLPGRVELDQLMDRMYIDDVDEIACYLKLAHEPYAENNSLLYDWTPLFNLSNEGECNAFVWLMARYEAKDTDRCCVYTNERPVHTDECLVLRCNISKVLSKFTETHVIQEVPVMNVGYNERWLCFLVALKPKYPLVGHTSWESLCMSSGLVNDIFSYKGSKATVFSVYTHDNLVEDIRVCLH